jgi:hypothetical protein
MGSNGQAILISFKVSKLQEKCRSDVYVKVFNVAIKENGKHLRST